MARRSSRLTLTEAERDARRQADRERLEQAARELLTSDGWQRWIRVRATNGLARYSLRNQWIIASEAARRGITPTYVAGFRAFLALNRCVRKGQTAIRILAPVAVKQRDTAGEETGETKVFFRAVPVFDVAMTEPLPGTEPVPLAPPAQPIAGDSHADLIAPLQRLGRELGYTVERRELPERGPQGWCDPERKEIVVGIGPANREVRTLVHELAHALGLGYAQYGRERAEVLVDSVTYCVLGAAGLDVGGESIPYVAGWGEDGALDAIREYAHTIDQIARRLEDAIGAGAPPADAPTTLPAEHAA
jgi:hypothetical protein